MNSIFRRSLLSLAVVTGGAVAGPAIAGQAVAGPETAAQAAAGPETAAELVRSNSSVAAQPHPPPDQGKRVLHYDYQRQPNSYYCAPAATRIALSTKGKIVSQREVAKKLGTTEAGTNSVNDTTRVLNELTGGGYETTEIEGAEANPEQVGTLRTDVVEAVDAQRGVVANITGTAVDTHGNQYSYESGHYVSVVGYRNGGHTMRIADPYDPTKHYWMRDEKVADWIAERGYSS
ncbi:C39 family peptidase [Micromonospora sp. DT47]|uniref:C39 family peptidase n=1 Tax=Micromonospora sp. DT47 TaxID=3393431 RepID=UPI003CEB9711